MISPTAAGLLLCLFLPVPRRQDDSLKTFVPGQYMGLSFDVIDIDGAPRTLFPAQRKDAAVEAKKPPTTVVVFFSLYDPSSAVAVERLSEIQAEYANDALEIVLVDSNVDEIVAGSGDPLEKFRVWREEKKVTLPLLIDRGNVVADRFGALCANQAFVIDSGRIVRYVGGIDDDPHGKRRASGAKVEPYLRLALDAVLAGKEPEVAATRPFAGRPIKRAPVEGVSR